MIVTVLFYILALAFGPGIPSVKSRALDNSAVRFPHVSLKQHLTSSFGLRKKRDESFMSTDAEDCFGDCFVPVVYTMLMAVEASNESVICSNVNVKLVTATCNGYENCMKRCSLENPPEDLETFQFMCIDKKKDFQKYMPCLSSACHEAIKQCEPCDLNDTISLSTEQGNTSSQSPVANSTDDLASDCLVYACFDCIDQVTTKNCGVEAANLQKKQLRMSSSTASNETECQTKKQAPERAESSSSTPAPNAKIASNSKTYIWNRNATAAPAVKEIQQGG